MCPRLEPQQHFEVACRRDKANVAVARVSCILKGSAAAGPSSAGVSSGGEIRMFSAGRVIKPKENLVFENAQIEVPG